VYVKLHGISECSRTYPMSDSSLTHLFHCRTSCGRRLWLLFTHDCTRAVMIRYTTLDATTEIRSTSETVEQYTDTHRTTGLVVSHVGNTLYFWTLKRVPNGHERCCCCCWLKFPCPLKCHYHYNERGSTAEFPGKKTREHSENKVR